jgi:Binding-prot-dependent transport system membrane comp, N-term
MTGPTPSVQPARLVSGDGDPPRNRGGAIPDVPRRISRRAGGRVRDGARSMLAYVVRRLGAMLVVMLIVASLVFVIVRIVPGDPAAVMLGDQATPQDVAELRAAMGLDRPLAVQFVIYLQSTLVGDLGQSIFLNRPVLVAERAELTLLLTAMSVVLAVAIGVPISVLSATKRGQLVDQSLMVIAMLAASLPSLWVGLTLIQYLALDLGWFPVAGYGSPHAGLAERMRPLQGDIPSPVDPPTGCVFRTRCRYALEACVVEVPPLRQVGPGHRLHPRRHPMTPARPSEDEKEGA